MHITYWSYNSYTDAVKGSATYQIIGLCSATYNVLTIFLKTLQLTNTTYILDVLFHSSVNFSLQNHYLGPDYLRLLWKISLLFSSCHEELVISEQKIDYFQNNKLYMIREILLVIFKIVDSRWSGSKKMLLKVTNLKHKQS